MVGIKQRNNFVGISDLTDSEVKILKKMVVWPFSTVQANFFNIGIRAGVSESHVSRCLRRLHIRGIVSKSLTGAWHVNEALRADIAKEMGPSTAQGYIPEAEQP